MAVQPGEFSGPSRRQKVLSCREHLAEFYECRPKLLEREPRALLRFEMRDFTGFAPLQYLPGVLEQRSDAGATHKVSEPMPHEDRADLTEAWQLAGRTEQPGDHELSYLSFFASVWSRSASATPASTPLATNAMRTLAPRIVASPPMPLANSPIMVATRALASTPTF